MGRNIAKNGYTCVSSLNPAAPYLGQKSGARMCIVHEMLLNACTTSTCTYRNACGLGTFQEKGM